MLHLYNTLTRKKEPFKPRVKGLVKVFTCGPSIYQRPHIGNYRTFTYEDILVRYLGHLGHRVERSIILTDVEDKAISEAAKKKGRVDKITDEIAKRFFRECGDLGIGLPDPVPRASTAIDAAVELIRRLMKKGHAYEHNGNIYFDPLKFPGFGKLFRLDMSAWPKKKVCFSRDTYNGRRWNRGDFILWHGYREGDTISWDTPIGKGRPAWNIQDPAVIFKHLGEQIDINCGGIDNIYRHHDYNIAVMESATGKEFARYYLHGEHLVVEGKTMSKSRGNILYPDDVTGGKIGARHLRFYLFYRHYRKKLNYTNEAFVKSVKLLDDFRSAANKLLAPLKGASAASSRREDPGAELLRRFEAEMNDDLSAGRAFDALFQTVRTLTKQREAGELSPEDITSVRKSLEKIDVVLGVIF